MIINQKKYIIYLLITWVFITAFNVFKPVHMDDTAYLESAKWISQNPLMPMSGVLNWNNTALAMYNENFPPLYPYMLAGVIKLFGLNIFLLHLLISIFTLVSIFLFYWIISCFIQKNRTWLTMAFFVSPFYIPSQNLMLDIPLLTFWLLFFFIIIKNPIKNKLIQYGLASIIILIACMMKYVSIILLPVLFLVIILKKDIKYAIILLIPILGIIAWSIINYFEYGGIHIFSTGNHTSISLIKIIKASYDWIIVLGGIILVTFPLFLKIAARKYLPYYCIIISGMIIIFLNLNKFLGNNDLARVLLSLLFYANGFLVFYIFCKEIVPSIVKNNPIDLNKIIILAWFFCGLIFIVVFSPFIAVRHVILALCPIFIAVGLYWERINKPVIMKIGVALMVIFCIIISISDFQYASIYKNYAKIIANRYSNNQNVWYLGYWGWQWYATEENLNQYDSLNSKLNI